MANKDNIKRLRDLAAGKLREADLPTLVGQVGRTVAEQARAVDLGHAIAAMDGAMDKANLRNGKGEISKWRIARAATRPTATGKRLVSGAAHGPPSPLDDRTVRYQLPTTRRSPQSPSTRRRTQSSNRSVNSRLSTMRESSPMTSTRPTPAACRPTLDEPVPVSGTAQHTASHTCRHDRQPRVRQPRRVRRSRRSPPGDDPLQPALRRSTRWPPQAQ